VNNRGRSFGVGMFFVIFWLVFAILMDHYVLGGGRLLRPLDDVVEEGLEYGICEGP